MDSRNSQASARKYHPTKLVRFETATTTTIFPVAVPGTPQTYKCYVRIWQIMRQGTKILGLLICWSYLPGGTTQHALQINLVSMLRGTYPVDACLYKSSLPGTFLDTSLWWLILGSMFYKLRWLRRSPFPHPYQQQHHHHYGDQSDGAASAWACRKVRLIRRPRRMENLVVHWDNFHG